MKYVKLVKIIFLFAPLLTFAQGFLLSDDPRTLHYEKWADLEEGNRAQDLRGIKPYLWRTLPDPVLSGNVSKERHAGSDFRFYPSLNLGYTYTNETLFPVIDAQAVTQPLLDHSLFGSFGRLQGKGHHAWLEPQLTLSYKNFLDLHVSPILLMQNEDVDFDNLRRAYILLNLRKLSIEVGRDHVEWGVGRLDHLMMGNNHEPFDMIRIRNNQPVVLPWIFKHLGPSLFESFVTTLDENYTFKNAVLIGSKLSAKPLDNLEVGLGYTVIFGGDGAPTNNPIVYFGEAFTDATGGTNRNFVFDIRYRSPLNIEPYAEIMFEDCCDDIPINPRDMLNLIGFHIPKVDSNGKLDLTVEWTRTNAITYRHGTFQSGYAYKGKIMGSALGPDAMGIHGQSRYWWSKNKIFTTLAGYEVRGRAGKDKGFSTLATLAPYYEVPEQRLILLNRLQWNVSKKNRLPLWINMELGVESIQGENFIRDRKKNNVIAGISLQSSFDGYN